MPSRWDPHQRLPHYQPLTLLSGLQPHHQGRLPGRPVGGILRRGGYYDPAHFDLLQVSSVTNSFKQMMLYNHPPLQPNRRWQDHHPPLGSIGRRLRRVRQMMLYNNILRYNPIDAGKTIIPDLATHWEVSEDVDFPAARGCPIP